MFKHWILTVAGALLAVSLQAAELSLQAETSVVSFLSTEKEGIAKTHTFETVSGSIKDNQTTIKVMADSLTAIIKMPDTPLKSHLLKARKHAEIQVNADTAAVIAQLEAGQAQLVTIPAKLSLLGVDKEVMLNTFILKNKDGSILMNSIKPVLIRTADYGITDSVRKLSKLASGIEIASAVPVNFTLYFK